MKCLIYTIIIGRVFMEKVKIVQKKDYSWLKTVIITLIVLFIVDNYFFSIAIVEGESMFPTINPSDRLIYIKTPLLYKVPKKGDIIIFEPPEELGREGLFVKRVIATEEDKYHIGNGVLTVNDIEIKETYICDGQYLNKDYPNTEGLVPQNEVFVLGDNRNNSNDSRRFSCVHINDIKGKVVIRLWPFKKVGIFTNPFI